MIKYKKIFLILGILILFSPLGIIVPHLFNASNGWGEWSLETVHQQTGHEPVGMKKDAAKYHPLIPDYNPGSINSSLSKRSVNYLISGLIGTGIILILTFGVTKFMSKKP